VTQTPHDQLAKLYLQEFLAPFGVVERQYEVPGEAKQVDVWFVPHRSHDESMAEMGILGRMTQGPSLLEAFRNTPTRTEVRTCLLKLLWIQDDEQRKTNQEEQRLSEADLPMLWILAAKASRPLLADMGGLILADWLPGIYFMPKLLRVAIVVIDELPETAETLWLRILGRGNTQERAIRELLALPQDFPRRSTILRLLAAWKVKMDMGELTDFTEREEIMALSEAFLTWEQEKEIQSKQEERQAIALNMLKDNLPLEQIVRLTGLTIEQVQILQAQSEQN
jgi:hypothetical protein